MPTKGRDIKDRRGRSPLFPRKVETEQQTRSLVNHPSSPERKLPLTSTETRKIPIYEKHTVSSSLYALNTIKPPSVDNARYIPQSKVISPKSKFNEKKAANTSNGLIRKPKKQTRQPTKLLEADKIVTHYEDDKTVPIVNNDILTSDYCDEQRMDREDDDHGILTCEVDEHISIEHTDEDTNQHDQPDTTSECSSDQLSCFEVDQEQVVEQERCKDADCDEEVDRTEVNEEPKEEEGTENEVVAHGKKETAAYSVIEEVLREERLNRVKALVGTFEILISLQCDALQNNCQHIKV